MYFLKTSPEITLGNDEPRRWRRCTCTQNCEEEKCPDFYLSKFGFGVPHDRDPLLSLVHRRKPMSTAPRSPPLGGGSKRPRSRSSSSSTDGNHKKKTQADPRRCGSCMYFWPFCDECVCPPPHQYCPKKHPIIRRIEHQVVQQQLGMTAQMLETWDQELTPEQYVKKLVRHCHHPTTTTTSQ